MMVKHQIYEDFRIDGPLPTPDQVANTDDMEEEKLAAFEKGYSAGWEDSLKAHAQADLALTNSLTQAVQKAQMDSDGYFGVFSKAVTPLISEIINTVLPEHAQHILQKAVFETVNRSINQSRPSHFLLRINEAHAALGAKLQQQLPEPKIDIVYDESLSIEQAIILADASLTEIDVASALQATRKGLAEAFQIKNFGEQNVHSE